MRLLILGINYAPEPVGIGPYTAEMARSLAERGHAVDVVTAKPYYPQWALAAGYERRGYIRREEGGAHVVHAPLYVPAKPSGAKRVVHHASFAASALWPALRAAAKRKPELVFTIAPSMMSAPVARLAARVAGAASWLHIQDFEVGAAFATGLLTPNSGLGRLARRIERVAYGGFDRYSSISPQMCARFAELGVPAGRVVEFRNWSDIAAITPMETPSPYRQQWGIATPHVALYSGNISNKQGIGIIVEAARRLRARDDLTFVVCGEGPQKAQLVASAGDLPNIRFHDLQPRERLHELMGLATIHLLPQLAGAADLVLPSKLTNMLASGRPVVATADAGTGLADEVSGCGVVTPAGEAAAFADGIVRLLDDPRLYAAAAHAARARAEERWSKAAILGRIERLMIEAAAARRR